LKWFIVVLTALMLAACSFNSITISKPNGTIIEGKSMVFNNSEEVILEAEGEAYSFKFRKVGTDGTPQAEVVSNTIGTVTEAVLP